VVVNNARSDERYANDPYILRHAPQSLLAMPIVHHRKFIGILYLENNLTTGAFTSSRIDLLTLMAGQIAVSLENSMLYENLEQRVQERTEELNLEKQKSEKLLLNILPVETADELKRTGKAVPRAYEEVTVLFTDFKDFTQLSEKLSAEHLVRELDTCFGAFDNIMGQFGIEKIKTIGDSYMCVGGLPVPSSTHALDTVHAALAIRDWMKAYQEGRARAGLPYFQIRIGLHSGPLVSGVVGTSKFAYDVWGETVNTAARMESSGEAGCINVSGSTYSRIKNHFRCTYRGKLPAKNMGDIAMYFVEGPAASDEAAN